METPDVKEGEKNPDQTVDSGTMLANSGQVWTLAESVIEAMQETQSALMRGEHQAAYRAWDRGRRIATKLAEAFNPPQSTSS